jgi:uncharacterized membrane protein YccC
MPGGHLMTKPFPWPLSTSKTLTLTHSLRTTVAVLASAIVARTLGLSEYYWAPITTVVVTQSTLGASWTISLQRLIGTALGAGLAVLLTICLARNLFGFSIGVFLAGLICGIFPVMKNAYRFAGVALAVVILIPRPAPIWDIALHRFIEVSIGIAVALAVTALWPEADPPPAAGSMPR